MSKIAVYEELKQGGEWLGAARRWLQSNIHRGDTLSWSSGELVTTPFLKFEEYALLVATAAVAEDREKRNKPKFMVIDSSVRPCLRTTVLECGKTITPEIINKLASGGGSFPNWLCHCKDEGLILSVEEIHLVAEAVQDNWKRYFESC